MGLIGSIAAFFLVAAPAPAKHVTVPFELLRSGHMAVHVKVNGKGPYRLIFDTGAPMNLINNRIAKDSGVVGAKTKRPGIGIFGMMGQQEIKVLEVGPARMEKASVVVMDHPTVSLISEALGPIDGIIGFPFFAQNKTTIAVPSKRRGRVVLWFGERR